jgi:hypothetical protein
MSRLTCVPRRAGAVVEAGDDVNALAIPPPVRQLAVEAPVSTSLWMASACSTPTKSVEDERVRLSQDLVALRP